MCYIMILIMTFLSLDLYATIGDSLRSKADFEAIENSLQNEPITKIASFSPSGGSQPTHTIKIVTLENGLKALFKTGRYPYAEVAGYKLSKLLNLFLVPPTVFRTINKTFGSLQLYIPSFDLSSVSDPAKFLKQVGKNTVSSAKFYYYLAGYWDIHYGNQLIEETDAGYRLWLIDSSSILHRTQSIYGGVTFKEKGSRIGPLTLSCRDFPFDDARRIRGKAAHSVYAPFLSTSHLKVLASQSQNYLIWNSTLWIEYITRKPSAFGRYTTSYSASLLDACRKLTRDDLTSIWSEWLEVDPDSGNDLIELTLKRRDELLKASLRGRIIKDDRG